MSFDEEWAGARAEAQARHAATMKLANFQGGDRGSGNQSQYRVTAADLTHHAGKADTVRGDFAKVDDTAMRDTGPAGVSLKGFASAAAFKVFEERWKSQMTYVEGVLEKDVSADLRAAALTFDDQEHENEKKFRGRGKGANRTLK